MALNDEDKKNAGMAKLARKHFGKSADGKSFLGQSLGNVANVFTLNALKENKDKSSYNRKSRIAIGTMMGLGFVPFMLIANYGNLQEIIYDGSVQNDAVFNADRLENATDETGYTALYIEGQGAYILNRNGDDYQLYQGKKESSGDYTFYLISDNARAANISYQIANSFETMERFPQQAQTAMQMYVENLSENYNIEGSSSIVRLADEPSYSNLGPWSYQDLESLFDEASIAFENGQTISVSGTLETVENELVPPSHRPGGLLETYLGALGVMAGGALGYGAISANAASRRRYKNEQSKSAQPRP